MDLWADVNQQNPSAHNSQDEKQTESPRYPTANERRNEESPQQKGYPTNPRAYARNSIERNGTRDREREREREYENQRPNPNQRKREFDDEETAPRYAQRRNNSGDEYHQKKKYYEDNVDGNSNNRYKEVPQYHDEDKIDSDSDEESTITMPETGRKVEHIAQKLEQTAQKYARGLSPSKYDNDQYRERERERERERDGNYDNRKYDKERNTLPRASYDDKEKDQRNFEKLERERTAQKEPRYFERESEKVERTSSRRYDPRPRPPFEDAPERPSEVPPPYRERRYSDKEEIYGETPGRYIEKERGYESNFETKLERSKVAEKHSYQKIDQRAQSPLKFDKNGQKIPDHNDTNNNTLKNEKKMSRQNIVQNTRNFELDKSPKLVKRTKSFWRFRRDSDVLEGMALWQHRSLVDIPKMLKKEERERERDNERPRKSVTPDNIEKEIHREKSERVQERIEEPKPAERSHKPDKTENPYGDEFPTPAERPKVTERSEYRMGQDDRAYFVGNISRKAILENERKRSLEAKQNMVVAELKETNEVKKTERRKKAYGDDDDGLIQNFSETEASDEESTYSCIVVKDQVVAEKTLLPRTKLRKDGDRDKTRERERDRDRDRERNTCGPWYDLWGVDPSVKNKKQ